MAKVSQKDEAFRQYALTGSPLKVILSTCAPLALFQALQSIFKILDALMASHIGAEAVSAVSALSQITLMITALGSGLAVGGSIKISEAYGRGDYDMVRTRVATVYAMAIGVSVLVAVTLVPLAEPFLRLLKTPEELIRAGAGYFRIEILTLTVSFFNTVFIAIERSRGHAKKILSLNMVIIAVKLSLTAVFVYGMGGGLEHIALATLAGQLVMLAYALISMVRDDGAFRFSMKNIRRDRETLLRAMSEEKFKARCEVIAPLDPMMWDRKLIRTLFGFEYSWEIYTPAVKRKYGYYVLPMIVGEGFAGRVEAVRDEKAGVLRVKHVWFEEGVRRTKKLDAAVHGAMRRLAKFNGCKEVIFEE